MPARVTSAILSCLLLVVVLLAWHIGTLPKTGAAEAVDPEYARLMGLDKPLGGQIKEVHELVGTIGYFLIGTHAAAALFHHYLKRDNTLRAMLPTTPA